MSEEKRNGYIVIDKRKFEPTLPLYCPQCNHTTLHSDNRYLLRHQICAKCFFSYEMELLSNKKIDESMINNLRGIKVNPGES